MFSAPSKQAGMCVLSLHQLHWFRAQKTHLESEEQLKQEHKSNFF